MKRKFKKMIRKETREIVEIDKQEIEEFSIVQKLPEEAKKELLCVIKGYVMAKNLNNI